MSLIGLVIGSIFMEIFNVSGDAMLHCFILDEELNENNHGIHKPPADLQEFVANERDEKR